MKNLNLTPLWDYFKRGILRTSCVILLFTLFSSQSNAQCNLYPFATIPSSSPNFKFTNPDPLSTTQLTVQAGDTYTFKFDPESYFTIFYQFQVTINGVEYLCKRIWPWESKSVEFKVPCNATGVMIARLTSVRFSLVGWLIKIPVLRTQGLRLSRPILILPNIILPPLPVVNVLTNTCAGNQQVCIPDNGYDVYWYNSPLSNTPIGYGPCINYNFPAGPTVLYTEYRKNINGCPVVSARSAYSLTIVPPLPPPPPTPNTSIFACPGTQEICIPTNGNSVNWYNSLTATTPICTLSCINYNFTQPITTLYMEYVDACGQKSLTKSPYTVILNPLTAVIPPPLGMSYVFTGTGIHQVCIPDNGYTVEWFDSLLYVLLDLPLPPSTTNGCVDYNFTTVGSKTLYARYVAKCNPKNKSLVTPFEVLIIEEDGGKQDDTSSCDASERGDCKLVKACPDGTYVIGDTPSYPSSSFSWSPVDGLSDPTVANPTIEYRDIPNLGYNTYTRTERISVLEPAEMENSPLVVTTCVDLYKCDRCGDTGSGRRPSNSESVAEGISNSTSKLNGDYFSSYPNPASDQVTISYGLNAESTSNISYVIYNQMGEVVLKEKLNSSSGVKTIDLSNLSSGSYTNSIQINGNIAKIGKLVLIK